MLAAPQQRTCPVPHASLLEFLEWVAALLAHPSSRAVRCLLLPPGLHVVVVHGEDILGVEHPRELGVVDLAVAIVVGEVDEGLDGRVVDVGDVELDQQPLDLLALQVARAVVVDGLEGVRQPAVLRQKLWVE